MTTNKERADGQASNSTGKAETPPTTSVSSAPQLEPAALPWTVEYMRQDDSDIWHPMAAFDFQFVAESYAARCANETWKYRVVKSSYAIPEGWTVVPDNLFSMESKWVFGSGTPLEEKVIAAGTAFITRTIGHYSTGDRRFTVGLFCAMLAAVKGKL